MPDTRFLDFAPKSNFATEPKRPPCVVGIDVSTDHLDIAYRPEPTRWRVAHDRVGMAECLAPLRQRQPAPIGLEATGGWPCAVVAALAVAKLPVAVMNPRQIRDLAKATGPLAKTDALDAGVIAHVAEAVRPTPRPLPDEMTPQSDALLQRPAPTARDVGRRTSSRGAGARDGP